MSTAGFYNVHVHIDNPHKHYPGMDSQQAPFFFGGSQVPINLGFQGSGLRRAYKSHLDHQRQLSTQGRGIHTTVQKSNKIFLPHHLVSIKK